MEFLQGFEEADLYRKVLDSETFPYSRNLSSEVISITRLYIAGIVMEMLNVCTMMIVVLVLNHTNLRNSFQGRSFVLFKGAFIAFCFCFAVFFSSLRNCDSLFLTF